MSSSSSFSSASTSSRFDTSLFEAARHEAQARSSIAREEDVNHRRADEQRTRVKMQDKLFLALVVELGICFSFLHIYETFRASCVCKAWAGAARAFFANARRVAISVPGGGGCAATEATVRRLLGKLALCESLDLSRCINVTGNTLRFLAPACGASLRAVDVSWCRGVSASSISQRLVAEGLFPRLSTVTARGIFVEERLAEVAVSSSSSSGGRRGARVVVGKDERSTSRLVDGGWDEGSDDDSLRLCIGSCELFRAGGEVWRKCLCARTTTVAHLQDLQGKGESARVRADTSPLTSFFFAPRCRSCVLSASFRTFQKLTPRTFPIRWMREAHNIAADSALRADG